MNSRKVWVGVIVLLAGFLAFGCTTTKTTPEAKSGPAAGAKDEYLTIAPEIGSRVKKRVKRSELQAAENPGSQRKKFKAEDLEQINLPDTAGQMERRAN